MRDREAKRVDAAVSSRDVLMQLAILANQVRQEVEKMEQLLERTLNDEHD
jgi:hypothetical protein